MSKSINVLVIGLGSMGKRRIRNLQALGESRICGFDISLDRCKICNSQLGIDCFTSWEKVITSQKFDAWIISVPPDVHHIYMRKGVESGVPCFIEASVVNDGLAEIEQQAKLKDVLLAPSCTLYFHPAIKKINDLVRSNKIGKISNLIYHSGQYLPDWHTYEKVSDYYVSKKETGGAREIVPFELTWITKLFGYPEKVAGFVKKTINIVGAEQIDDTYNIIMDFGHFLMSMVVDVVSRSATRKLMINGSEGMLYWDWDNNEVCVFEPANNQWRKYEYEILSAESGYNKNITEQMYIDEIDAFLKAAFEGQKFPNSINEDIAILELLYKVESSIGN